MSSRRSTRLFRDVLLEHAVHARLRTLTCCPEVSKNLLAMTNRDQLLRVLRPGATPHARSGAIASSCVVVNGIASGSDVSAADIARFSFDASKRIAGALDRLDIFFFTLDDSLGADR